MFFLSAVLSELTVMKTKQAADVDLLTVAVGCSFVPAAVLVCWTVLFLLRVYFHHRSSSVSHLQHSLYYSIQEDSFQKWHCQFLG